MINSENLKGKNIFIWGLSGSGKDTTANILVENFGYLKVRIADTVKRIIMETKNLTFEELEEQKRIDPALRELHHTVGKYLDKENGTRNRISQIIAKTSLDIVNLPENLKVKSMVVCDCRSIDEAKQFLEAGWYGIYLNKKPSEYQNNTHWTEKDIFENGDIQKLIELYGNQNIIIINNDDELSKNPEKAIEYASAFNSLTNGCYVVTIFIRHYAFDGMMKHYLNEMFFGSTISFRK